MFPRLWCDSPIGLSQVELLCCGVASLISPKFRSIAPHKLSPLEVVQALAQSHGLGQERTSVMDIGEPHCYIWRVHLVVAADTILLQCAPWFVNGRYISR